MPISRERVLENYQVGLDAGNVFGFFEEHRPLSNYHLEPFTWQGVVWPASENAYQAAKTTDRNQRTAFTRMDPGSSKTAGRNLAMRPDWELVKAGTMLAILWCKFRDCPTARSVLLSTGKGYLEETNWWGDQYWGYCDNRGLNRLGHTLMLIRSAITSGIPAWATMRDAQSHHYIRKVTDAELIAQHIDPMEPCP